MTAGETEWLLPAVVLAAGIAVAFLLFRLFSRPQQLSWGSSDTSDLRTRFNVLVGRLRELDEGGEIAFGDPVAERRRLERDAAIILREIEARPDEPVATLRKAEVAPETVALRRLGWLTAIAVVAAVMYVLLMQFSTPRIEGPMTGASATDPQTAALEARVTAAPTDFDARIELAKRYLERQEMVKVFEQTQYVLERDSKHARALSYQALVRLSMGEGEASLQMLRRALEFEPDLLEAWLHLAIVYVEMGNREAAIGALDVAKQRHPESTPMLQLLRDEIDTRFNGVSGKPTPAYSITIDAARSGPGVLFVTLRSVGSTSGPPIAVKRVASPSFPLQVELTAADSMQGVALPLRGRIEARIDTDGDPLTREESAPRAVLEPAIAGKAAQMRLQ